MKCLEGYIGVGLHCSANESISGKYLVDLPGVTLQNIDSIANEDQLSFLGVFAEVEKRAISRISKDVLSYMKTTYNFKKSVNTYAIETTLNGQIASENKKVGLTILNDCINVTQDYLVVHIQTISLYALEEKTTTLFIYSDNVLVKSLSVNTAVGWNSFTINEEFPYSNLVIAYDSSLFDNISNSSLTDVCDCDIDCLSFKGVSFDSIEDRTTGNNTFGIKTSFSIRCSYDSVLCANVDIYSDAYLYCLGVELMRERIYSDRINRFTTVDKKKAQELLPMFLDDYTDFLNTANSSIIITDDYCIECLEPMGKKVTMP